jgi:hypothetical protein
VAKLTKKALLKHLAKSDKEDIIREVVTLFDKFKNVKEFYTAELTDTANPLLESYKKRIAKAYLLANPKERSTNINVNKLINEFKKISIYEREVADLMLHRVECGVAAFNRKTNRSATFYNCILNSFEEAANIISAENYTNEFKQRINKIIEDSNTGKFEFQKKMKGITKAL